MTQEEFEDRLSALIAEGTLAGLSEDEMISSLEVYRQTLIDQELSKEID